MRPAPAPRRPMPGLGVAMVMAMAMAFTAGAAHADQRTFVLESLQGPMAVSLAAETRQQTLAFGGPFAHITRVEFEFTGAVREFPTYLLDYFGGGEAPGTIGVSLGLALDPPVPGGFNLGTGITFGPLSTTTSGPGYEASYERQADGSFLARVVRLRPTDSVDAASLWEAGIPGGGLQVSLTVLPMSPTDDASFYAPGALSLSSARLTLWNETPPVPEPAAWLLMAGGLAALVAARMQATRRRAPTLSATPR